MKTKTRIAGAVVAVAVMVTVDRSAVEAQAPAGPTLTAQQFFEAGQYDEALKFIGEMRVKGSAGLPDAFLAAQIALKQTQSERAKEEFARLRDSADPVWKAVGESGLASIENLRDEAAASGAKAVEATKAGDAPAPEDPAGMLRAFHAYYQLGLAQTRREEWTGAAEAFTRAVELNPTFAYAHYYAGLSYSRIKRPDQVAKYLEMFVKLAPKAPERSAVSSMLKAIRGV